MNYLEALDHPDLFGRWFSGPSWRAWRVVEKAIFGLELEPDELPLFRELTGREEPPTQPCTEAWIIAGRRSAKSRKAATIAVYLSTVGAEIQGYRHTLAPGERGVVLIMAIDRRQAQVTLNYAAALFREVPMLRAMVERETAEGLELTNGMALLVLANDFRSIRGRTLVACILDEISYWRSELTVTPDVETYRAAKPALATVKGSLLIGISSPYRRTGLLWRKFKQHWSRPGDVLVVKAPTTVLNPEISRQIIDEALEDDPEAARAEWLSEFRNDLSDFVRREVVEGLVSIGVHERPPVRGVTYQAFTDPSGGSNDSFTLGVVHREGDVAVLDVLRERRPPFAPEAVVEEFASVVRSYGMRSVVGDKYAGEWPREQFQKRGVWYKTSDLPKSQIYLECLPLLNGGRIDLLDDDRLVNQICGLERRTARGGKDSVDHAPHAHDDLANAALGASWLAAGKAQVPPLVQQRLLGV
jgi:hypothetical protein